MEVDPLTGAIDEERLIYVLNPTDGCAVEEAVRIKERWGGEVTVITVGPPRAEGALRQCLAIGADRALRLWSEGLQGIGALSTAQLLSQAIRGIGYDVVLCGAEGADWGSGQVGPAIAELLGLPQVCGITELKLSPDGRSATAQRKLEGGEREVVECPLPALFAVDASLNEPRYPSLSSWMEALIRDIPCLGVDDLGVPRGWLRAGSRPRVLELSPPRPRPRKIFTPDSNLPAHQRIDAILSAGMASKKGLLVEGAPEELVERILEFLGDKGIIGAEEG